MPRVTFVKSARKSNPVASVGESYYWWKFRFGGKRYSKTPPRPSQLTQSAYLGTLYGISESISDYEIMAGDEDAVHELRDDISGQLNELLDETQESLDNMPESLQYSPTGELLQERIDALDNAISEVDNIEAPDQWQEVTDAQEEYDEWQNREPDDDYKIRFEEWEADEPERGAESWDEYEAVLEEWQANEPSNEHEEWQADEPDLPDDYEEFAMDDLIVAVEEAII